MYCCCNKKVEDYECYHVNVFISEAPLYISGVNLKTGVVWIIKGVPHHSLLCQHE